jgi:type IV pilus assembly protein PilA
MVVVAIIGILSAIAVPNFKKYQAKSKQSEAKIQLAAVYSAEVGTSADWDTYATCLTLMGYETPPRGYYAIGFDAGFNATSVSPNFTGCIATATPVILPLTQLAAVLANKATDITLATSKADQNTFLVAAEGSISAAVSRDIWEITETKALTNRTPGY